MGRNLPFLYSTSAPLILHMVPNVWGFPGNYRIWVSKGRSCLSPQQKPIISGSALLYFPAEAPDFRKSAWQSLKLHSPDSTSGSEAQQPFTGSPLPPHLYCPPLASPQPGLFTENSCYLRLIHGGLLGS